ncbi:MAG: Asp23/Gls24 family envelope stress response protein [Chloroflexota bacterium]|nr:Asp23/Gls24 family envelope stress response protein [Chloroflexota bacterium]
MLRRGRRASAIGPTGKVEISRRAIAQIVHDAVMESYGVVGMVPRTLRGNLAYYLGQDDPGRGIEVEVHDDDRIEITLYVVLEYGTRISEVAHNVMESVKFAVEHALGMEVAAVNVHVQGLHFSDDGNGGRK